MANTVRSEPILRAEGLCKIYHAGEEVHALRDVDLRVAAGELLAIMGASGSGKSTLMNILGCLDRPTSGRYWLDGVDTGGLDKNALAALRNQRIGFVFQGFQLLARTSALENVELPLIYDRSARPAEARERAAEALRRVGLGDRFSHEPSQLSGGQQQRVAIARALVNRPRLILADEPTGNLDTRTSMGILALFQELNAEGATIVLVTHEDDVARCSQRVIVLADGRITRDAAVSHQLDARARLAELAA